MVLTRCQGIEKLFVIIFGVCASLQLSLLSLTVSNGVPLGLPNLLVYPTLVDQINFNRVLNVDNILQNIIVLFVSLLDSPHKDGSVLTTNGNQVFVIGSEGHMVDRGAVAADISESRPLDHAWIFEELHNT